MMNPEKSFYLVKTLFLFFDRKNWCAKDKFIFYEITITYIHVPIVLPSLI